ncbi:MAG: DUF4416 family protein [Candidatus Marinimicrobia bacterium]|nr:DUF4416 family protein [Candidatus Neomarinimicrobiota bacterium]
MGKINSAPLGLLFYAIAVNNKDLFKIIERKLEKKYGNILFESEIINFSEKTNYYKKEMGSKLWKKYYSYETIISLEDIFKYKYESNKLEDEFKTDDKRNINLDPGYITLFNFSLLTTKGYSHRIYLEKGIYSEITLIYKNKKYEFLPWTYPDYKYKNILWLLERSRLFLKENLSK